MPSQAHFRIVAVFAAGYFASYIFRGVNIGFAPILTQELGLSAADLGMLTSAYFLGFACAQIPVGVLLDRFGSRRVTGVLMAVAGIGALVVARADGMQAMLIGRLLIGIGVSSCLGGAFKALAQTFPVGRLPMLNGIVMAVGGLGGVAVGSPLAWLLTIAQWRTISMLMAGMTFLVAIAIWFGAPEPKQSGQRGGIVDQLKGTAYVLTSRLFWKLALLSSVTQGVFYGMQSLWAGAFLRDVEAAGTAYAATLISVLGIAFIVGNIAFGGLARAFLRHGVTVHAFCTAGMLFFVVVQALIVAGVPLPPVLLWSAYGAFGCIGILTYAVLAEHFPVALIGRVNTTFTLVIFLLIFAFQVAVGQILNLWPVQDGHYPAVAHRIAWGGLIALQVASAAWGLWPARRSQARPAGEQ